MLFSILLLVCAGLCSVIVGVAVGRVERLRAALGILHAAAAGL